MQPMEVGSKALREVEFRQQLRGYHQDDVDRFLEEVAAAIEVHPQRLRDANERAARAEAAGPASSPPEGPMPTGEGIDDDAPRRALDVAQRTVSLLIQEAKEEARRLVSEAQARVREIIDAAESSADRRMAAGRDALREELSRLTAARAELAGQVAELGEKVEEGRRQARKSLQQALEMLGGDDPEDAPSLRRSSGVDSREGDSLNGAPPDSSSRGAPGVEAARRSQDLGHASARQGWDSAPSPDAPSPEAPSPEAAHAPLARPEPASSVPPRREREWADDLDDPDATRLIRLEPGEQEPGGVFDVEQVDP